MITVVITNNNNMKNSFVELNVCEVKKNQFLHVVPVVVVFFLYRFTLFLQ